MKKNLILLVALFLMQMVSAITYPKVLSVNSTVTNCTYDSKPLIDTLISRVGELIQGYPKNSFYQLHITYGAYYTKAENSIILDKKSSIVDSVGVNYTIANTYDKFGCASKLTNLLPNTKYRVRSFVIYSVYNGSVLVNRGDSTVNQRVYGKEITFTTRIAPPIITNVVSKISGTSITISGKITGDSITYSGIKITDRIGSYSYTETIRSVNINTNTDGTFSNIIAFTTEPGHKLKFDITAVNSSGTTYSYAPSFTTDIKDNTETNFKVYPNPSNGRFNVSFDNSTPNNKIKLFDITGKLVYSTEIQDTNTEIDLTDKQLKGVYLAMVFNKNGELLNKEKILINE